MKNLKQNTSVAGLLFIAAMVAGIFSVAPAVDSEAYITETVANADQVIFGALFQFLMALFYVGIAMVLYPVLEKYGKALAIGFLSFRLIAATLVMVGTVLLLSVLTLSDEFADRSPGNAEVAQIVGGVLRSARDQVNHVFMILALCAGNIMMYLLLFRSKLIPRWISAWGLAGAVLSACASILVLFRLVDIVTPEYLLLNAPTALQELILALWLITKGFDAKVLMLEDKLA